MFAPMKVTATFTGGESPDEVPPRKRARQPVRSRGGGALRRGFAV